MKLSDLKKVLKELSKEELSEIIFDLYKSNNAVKDFLQYHLNQSDIKLIDRYKAEIKKAINPVNQKLKLAKGRKALSNFKKIGATPEAQVELMFYYLEQGLIFSEHFNYRPDTFMNSLLSVYTTALKLIKSEYLSEKYAEWAKHTEENVYLLSVYWGQTFKLEFKKHII